MPPKVASETSSAPPPKPAKSKKGKKGKKRKDLKAAYAKGYLATPQDWARFNAWADIRALPKPLLRRDSVEFPSKPLGQLKKRLIILAKPQTRVDNFTKVWGISPMALKVRASMRTRCLARPRMRCGPMCKEFPTPITKAALQYIPTERLLELSQPGWRYQIMFKSSTDIANKPPQRMSSRLERLAAPKTCDLGDDSDEDRQRSTNKISSWMEILILPHYKFLKDREDKNAKKWKKMILDADASRGPQARKEELARQQRRRKKQAAKEKAADDADNESPDQPVTEEVEEETKNIEVPETTEAEPEPEEADAEAPDEEAAEPTEEEEAPAEDAEETPEDPETTTEEPEKEKDTKTEQGDDEASKKRFEERNAWRFVPNPDKGPPFITKGALTGTVPPGVDRMATPKPAPKSLTKEPFKVNKSAFSYNITPRVEEMAKPKHETEYEIQKDRDIKHEYNEFGQIIFPKPKYGKDTRMVKYKMKEEPCDAEPEKDENAPKVFEAIDPTVFAPTIDPCADPEGAKYQIKMRKKAKKILAEMKKEEEKQARLEQEKIDRKKKEKEDAEKEYQEQKLKWRKERGDPNVKNLEESTKPTE